MKFLLLALACCLSTAHSAVTQSSLSTLDALSRSGHSTLVGLIKYANLTDLFTGTDQLTIFAPMDNSWTRDLQNLGLTMDQLKANKTLLADVLSYHVIMGTHQRDEMWNERMFTSLSGDVLRTNHYVYNNGFFVDGSQISSSSTQTSNAMIYNIRHLLYPIKGNAYDTIANDKDLTTLKAAIDAAGLADFMRDQAPITVFAPTDAAFSLLGSKVQELLAKPDLLKEILEYHVVYGSLYRAGMHSSTLHTFEEKDQIHLTNHRFGQPEVDNARFTTTDISATNGVIHKISSVMVPSSLASQI